MKAWLFLAALFCFSPIAQADDEMVTVDIVGRYRNDDDKSQRFTVDTNHRLTTNMAVVDSFHHTHPLSFPHRLKFDDLKELYATTGYFTATYQGPYGIVNCQFPAKFEGDFGEDAKIVDVTFRIPTQFGLDAYGRCLSWGSQAYPMAFSRF